MTWTSPNAFAYVACWTWIGHDPSKWPAYFPDLTDNARRAALLRDPAAWEKACPNPLGIVVRNAVAVAGAESGWDPEAKHYSGPPKPPDLGSEGNWDHGGWQISNFWQPDKLAAHPRWWDLFENAAMAYAIWAPGKTFAGLWSTWDNGLYKNHIRAAHVALSAPIHPYPDRQLELTGIAAKVDQILATVTAPFHPAWLADDLSTVKGVVAAIRAKFS